MGTPVANHSSGNGVVRAVSPSSVCVGVLTQDAHTEEKAVFLTSGVLEMTDWTIITGTALLLPNTIYYLSTVTGKMTSTMPVIGQIIGTAMSPTALWIHIEPDPTSIALAAASTGSMLLMGA